MSAEKFKRLYWDAVKTPTPPPVDVSYLDLGGNSLGIFLFTEGVRKELGVDIPPEELLTDDATLARLTEKYIGA